METKEIVRIFCHSLKSGSGGLKNLLLAYLNLQREPLEMTSFPVMAQIEPTLYCNLKCQMCIYPLSQREKKQIEFKEFKRIIDQMPFVRKVSLAGVGEPLLNPDFFEMISYAKSKNITIGFVTNGMLLNEDNCRKVVNKLTDWVNISLDSADRDNFEKIRKGASFDMLISNLKILLKIKNRSGLPRISLWFVIMNDNLAELPEIIKLAKDLGINSVSAQLRHSWGNDFLKQDIESHNSKEFHDELKFVLKETIRISRKANVNFNYVNIPDTTASRACKWPWKACYITAEGFFTPCCFHASDPKSINFGNIFENNFLDIWNSEKYQKFRKALKSKHPPDICIGCTAYNKKLKI